ncbi:MAG TPA: sugar phosphate isomerase/epimerase [Clostridiales bacterium]|jgi:sugar phosphate isomerase/epimerase|nr:sugar phosphate isomerase/epimerase [Clostridiales bacterium]
MVETMRKYMKVGLIHFMAYPSTMNGEGPIYETIRKIAADYYFDAIEITHIKDNKVRSQVKKLLDTSHMTIAYCAQPRLLAAGLNINDTDEEGRLKAVQLLLESIDEAYEMGAVGFAFLSGKYSEDKKEQAYQALVKSTEELCAYAKSKGNMRVALEIFDYDIDKKSLIGPVELAKRFAEDITKKYNNFGLMVDLSHLPLVRETPEQSLIPIKDYIIHAHMGNAVVKDPSYAAYGDVHPRFGFPNSENDVDELVEFLKVLKGIGFLNEKNPPIVSFEVKPYGDEDSDVVIANAKRVLNQAWHKV